MKKISRTKLIYIRLIRPIIHYILILGSFYIIYNIRLYTDLIPFIKLRVPFLNANETFIFALFSACFFLIVGAINGIYELFKPLHGFYAKFIKSWLIWIIITSFIAYFGHGFIFQSGISRFVLIRSSIVSLIAITIFDIIINSINSKFEKKHPYNMLVLFNNKKFFDKIQKNYQNYNIYKIIGLDILENDLKENVQLLKQADIILTVGSIPKDILQEIIDFSRGHEQDTFHIPTSYFLDDLVYTPERVGPILVFEYKASPLDGRYRVMKRVFDIIFSSIFIVLFRWIYAIIGIFILIKDGRPIIYKSIRTGKGGKPFEMYKFRTMIKNADKIKEELLSKNERKGPLFKIKDDPRIPKWGKFLRKTSLDELPQMFNIFLGNMSVVGPRPHLPSEVEKYSGWQKRLLSIKPGITGYSQIFGRDKLEFDEEAKLDLYYIQNWNLFLDFYVIVSTIKVVFDGK